MRPEDVIRKARAMIGIPFLHQGRDPALGVDCMGLISVVAISLELADSGMDRTDYPRFPHPEILLDGLSQFCDPFSLDSECLPPPGSVVVVNVVGQAIHCGWSSGTGLIHAYSTSGKVVEHLWVSRWANRISSVWMPRRMILG
jgi:cell wall-associated NlpC family hydrolase